MLQEPIGLTAVSDLLCSDGSASTWASPVRPAPSEPRQDRKVAAVGGCSGAIRSACPLFYPTPCIMLASLLTIALVAQSAPQDPNWFISPIAIFLIFIVFYFFIIRPQQQTQKKKEKERAEMIEALKKGDKIITVGGLHGTVAQLGETSVTVEIDKTARLRIEKSAIDRLA